MGVTVHFLRDITVTVKENVCCFSGDHRSREQVFRERESLRAKAAVVHKDGYTIFLDNERATKLHPDRFDVPGNAVTVEADEGQTIPQDL